MADLASRLAAGDCITMIGNSIPHTYCAELVASSGCDAVMIDLQHSEIALHQVNDLARAVRAQGATPIVRVTRNDAAEITKVLDGGVCAVIAPMINSRQECEQFIAACLYAPDGQRSFGPYLGQVITRETIVTYYEKTRQRLVPIAMIETEEGVQQAEAIFSVPHLGGVYIGASDLSVSLGLGCLPNYDNPKLLDRVRHLIELGRKHGVPVGAYAATIPETRRLKAMGARLLWVGSDQGFIKTGLLQRAAEYAELSAA